MKKLYFLTLLFLSILYSSQQTIDNNGFQNQNIFPTPVTAETYAISKVGKLPIDLYRGKANISIPIYSIIVDGLSIPISLSYSTGGIKLNEIASTVGLGWSLHIPGSIDKMIMDKDDDRVPFFDRNINAYSSYNNYVSHLDFDYDRRLKLFNLIGGGYDTKPDLYHYNLSSLSGSFITKDNSALTIPYEDVKIMKTNGNFTITDNKGNMYWFSEKNISMTYDPTNQQGTELSSTSLKVDSIRTIHNNTIKFYYEKEFNYNEKNIVERIYTKTGPDYDPHNSYFLLPPKYEKWENSSSNSEKIISRIEFPTGTVEFKYSNDENGALAINGDIYRKDLNSSSGIALRRVIVKNKSSHIISDNMLNYDYFASSNENKNYEDYRLKLINVYDALTQSIHKFSYNEDYNFPKRNANSDDYWGYINSLNNLSNGTNLPLKIYGVDLYGINFPPIVRRDRSPNPIYTQIGVLKSIEYPTGARKNLYYENPISTTLDLSSYVTIGKYVKKISSIPNHDELGGGLEDYKTESYILDYNNAPNDINLESLKIDYSFTNTCENARLTGPQHEITETSCFGNVVLKEPATNKVIKNFTSNGKPFTGEVRQNLPIKVELILSRFGDCRCHARGGLVWTKNNVDTTYVKNYLGGLRVRKVEDVDVNNISNVFEYKYGKYDLKNQFKEISILKKPFNFTRIDEKIYRHFDDTGVEMLPINIQKFFTLLSFGQAYNSYGASDVVTYPYVIEENGLGKTLYEFTDKNYNLQNLSTNQFVDYNEWHNGLLLSTKYINKAGDTVKVTKNEYEVKYLKNGLSNYTTNSPSKLAFAVDFNVEPSKIQIQPAGPSNYETAIEGDIFYVKNKINYIESGKIENFRSTTKDFLENGTLSTIATNKYYDTDINKPINLEKTIVKSPDSIIQETNYEYAHEKGKQKLIDANMVGIPLETTVIKKQNASDPGKTIFKAYTDYSDTLPDTQTGNLLLPKSVSALNLSTGNMEGEVMYNQYDSKGNLLQYTTKSGITTAIIWGYNNTQPIAKIEGAKYSEVSVYIAGIVSKSDTDNSTGTPASEEDLINELDLFRKKPELSGFQITTYTYDPLIGVRSITPPSGIREVYNYDSANRLEEVIDVNGNILKEYQYNYKH